MATELIRQNEEAEEGHMHIPFESMLIGNGWTEPRTQLGHYETYSCANDSECTFLPLSFYLCLFMCVGRRSEVRDTYPLLSMLYI